tara:strand:- start:591 stop:1277 length:687 start_codon:yes stop_codon:yes gene_type:complete
MSEINTNENKAKLWNECLNRNYFNKIPENLQENVQKKFEESVMMFSSQNTSNNSLEYINEQILKHFHDELISFTSYDKSSIIGERKNDFEKRLQEKQAEFDMMMNTSKPSDIDFTQEIDEPIKEDIDDLISKQTAERENQLKTVFSEQSVNDNLTKNEVIAPSFISSNQNNNTNFQVPDQSLVKQEEKYTKLIEEINDMKKIIEYQSRLLNNLTKTQIQILTLLKNNY